jgi:fumarylacetoacetase
MISWLKIEPDSDFSMHNIPFGIFSVENDNPRPATRIGDTVVDLSVLADFGYFDDLGIDDLTVFYQPVLNDFIALGKPLTGKVRQRIQELFLETCGDLKTNFDACELALFPFNGVTMHLPVHVRNYTDFYASEQHAINVGSMFRDVKNALPLNWKHLPIGYHGRASSIVASGAAIKRPSGQTKTDGREMPGFGPTKQLDFELEVGFIIGRNSVHGSSINTSETEYYIFGLVMFNDLSARDIQGWEYVPLGPFLAKNFGSVVSPWIVPLEALDPFRIPGPVQVPSVLPYLQYDGNKHFDVNLEIILKPSTINHRPSKIENRQSTIDNQHSFLLSSSNLRYLYWNFSQMLAHHTSNGCNVEVGDICASGTISGPGEKSWGSLLELSWNGTKPLTLADGTIRTFLEDFDTVTMRGYADKDGIRVGFGECSLTILPAG